MNKVNTFLKKTTTTSTSLLPKIDATTIMINGESLEKNIKDIIVVNTAEDKVLARCFLIDTSNNLAGINTFTNLNTFSGVSCPQITNATPLLDADIANVLYVKKMRFRFQVQIL